MKRLVVVTALFAVFGCAAGSDRELRQTFEDSRLALWRSDLPEAQKLIERGESLMTSGSTSTPTSDWVWKFRNLKAEVLIARLDLTSAISILQTTIPEGGDLDGSRARQKYLLARLQVARGSLAEAQKSLDQARTLLPPDDGETRPDVDALDGQIQLRLGRWADGESTLQAVLADATGRSDRQRQAKALNDLGMSRLLQNRCDEAVSWFDQVLNLPDIENRSLFANALNNSGACLARLGQFEKALVAQRRAVEIHERGSRAAYEQALGELGTTYLLQDDVTGSLPYLNRAFAIALEADQNEDAALWARNLAAAYVFAGQWDEAERFNNEARRLTPPARSSKLVWSTLHAARIAAGRGQGEAARQLFTETLAASQVEPRARWAAHDGLAGVSLAAGQRRQAASHFEAALDTIEKTRSDLRVADYRLSFLTDLIRFYRAYVDVLVAQGATDRALEIADSSRGRVLAERHGVAAPARASAASMRRLAKESNAVLLSYWLTPTRSYLWMIAPGSLQLRELPPAGEIEKLVREHQQAIASALVDPLAGRDTAGDRLYSILIAPVAGSIPAGGNVIIVPDGVLHGLNFETLPVQGVSRHYWIEDAVVQIAPSLAMLGRASAPADARRSLLLFGNAVAHEPEFPSLRYASTEMTSITRNFGSDRVVTYQAERASPSAYRSEELGRFGLVHFTAHAAPNVQSPLDSAIILSGTDTYKLYARDIANLPLSAELVTVSACRSAGERAYSGEGLVGFAWAFLRAGATRVIAGLWDVDDRSTAELMDALYARLAAGDPPARALREAKLSLLRRADAFAKPYYWAPFELFTVSPT